VNVPSNVDAAALLTKIRDGVHFINLWAGEVFAPVEQLIASGIAEPQPIPYFIRGKRGYYSANYLSEFITPKSLAVEETAATIRDKTGDELIRAAYEIVMPFRYEPDDRSLNYPDWWALPHETLNRQAGDCEDTSFALTSILIAAGVPRDKVRCCLGTVVISGSTYGHMWVEVMRDQWYWLETTWDDWRGWNPVPADFTHTLCFTDRSWNEGN
jgi:transglutaminase-like putative cysteine protease